MLLFTPSRPSALADAAFSPLVGAAALNAATPSDLAERVLTDEALKLAGDLHRRFEPRRQALLTARRKRQAAFDAGYRPDYLPAEACPAARGDWQVAPLPADMTRRRVEITGPVSDAKMVINMLSRTAEGHRADAAMLDFEDSMKPSWANVLQGVINVAEAASGTLRHEKRGPDGSLKKVYDLDPADMPLLMVRVRGLHLDESNLRVDGQPVAGGLLDLVLTAVHAARTLVEQERTPAYYVPKVEHHLEARWWADLFAALEDALGLDRSTFRATFLIETLPAAYQMEEILYELRHHAAGLNGGRWDKIFSDIKCLLEHPDRVLADRASIGMNRDWMAAYAQQLIRVCHRHGALAMGGMAAFTPGRTPEARAEQTAKVVADKAQEASIGHDGCWVSHPYFIGHALAPFLKVLGEADNQLGVVPEGDDRPDLLPRPDGPKTLGGLRTNVRVGIAYLEGWNRDIGCVAWDGLMEDLATLEISRAQTQQWLRHGVTLDGGETVTPDLVERVFEEELAAIARELAVTLDGQPAEVVAARLAAFRQAAADAQAVFTEPHVRPFLCLRSDLAGTDDHAVRAHTA